MENVRRLSGFKVQIIDLFLSDAALQFSSPRFLHLELCSQDLLGFYFDAEKNRYFPIKGPIPSSSHNSSSASTSYSSIQVQSDTVALEYNEWKDYLTVLSFVPSDEWTLCFANVKGLCVPNYGCALPMPSSGDY
ncbi:hypothetical protein LOK49_LG05G00998 [Camellia lanceoleosa]|uniref:Uncharacterized protein n=1 Tax=Camellia lanceoleosa TaxID=1840588 RepID=A0ACC0HQF9_9ERIC|nr:hypothetical protein LOK49_LG05G00998 [Camellia lanceoleosa]